MSQLFFATSGGNPAMYPLRHSVLLSESVPRDLVGGKPENIQDDVLLRPRNLEGKLEDNEWYLEYRHGRRGVWINGIERTVGFYLVGDEDRIRIVGGCSAVFTNEESVLAKVFPGSGTDVKCQRCFVIMQPGDAAVSCPQCGAWYHYEADNSEDCCWQSDPTCRFCKHTTEIGAALSRIPEVG